MKRLIVTTAFLLLLGAGTVMAQDGGLGFRGWGPRVGLTVNPDQVHFGLHADFGNFAQQVRFQPNFELGVGDGYTVGSANFEVHYRFRNNWDVWGPYVGGGVGVLFTDREVDGFGNRSDAESAVSVLGGIEKNTSDNDRLFFEAKFGLVEAPSLKLTLGWTFLH
jgi:hypothetical protein